MYNNLVNRIRDNLILNSYDEILKKGVKLNEVDLLLPISKPELYHILLHEVKYLKDSIITYEEFKRDLLKNSNITIIVYLKKIIFKFEKNFSLAVELQKQGLLVYIRCDSDINDHKDKLENGGKRGKYVYHIYNNDEETYYYFFNIILSDLLNEKFIISKYYSTILNNLLL